MQRRAASDTAGSPSDELCIRFVNTAAWRLRDPQEERLPTPEALLRWLSENGLGGVQHLARGASPSKATADLYRAAIGLREAIYRIFHARIESTSLRSVDLAVLNASLTAPAPAIELAFDGEKVGWRLGGSEPAPLDLLRR